MLSLCFYVLGEFSRPCLCTYRESIRMIYEFVGPVYGCLEEKEGQRGEWREGEDVYHGSQSFSLGTSGMPFPSGGLALALGRWEVVKAEDIDCCDKSYTVRIDYQQ